MAVGKSGKHYMNPSYMKSMGDSPDPEAEAGEAQHDKGFSSEDRGQLAHVEIHRKKEGGYHVHAHFHNPQGGHHVVASEHASKQEALAAAGNHMQDNSDGAQMAPMSAGTAQ